MPAHVHPSHVDCHPLREHLEHIQYDVATDQANRRMTPRGALLLEAMVPVLYLEKGGVYTRQLLLHTRRASILFASATMYPKCCICGMFEYITVCGTHYDGFYPQCNKTRLPLEIHSFDAVPAACDIGVAVARAAAKVDKAATTPCKALTTEGVFIVERLKM